jgi:hypothetical protein
MNDASFAVAKTKTRLHCFWAIVLIAAVTFLSCPSKGFGSALANHESALSVAELETFGAVGRQGLLYSNRKVVLFQHEGVGCLTHMWFGGDWPEYDRTRIRFYVDGETKASISCTTYPSPA